MISQAGSDPKVVGLVYIAAFALDNGESVGSMIKNSAPGAAAPPILPPQDGFLLLDPEKFPAAFAADVKSALAEFMAKFSGALGCGRFEWRGYRCRVEDKAELVSPYHRGPHGSARRRTFYGEAGRLERWSRLRPAMRCSCHTQMRLRLSSSKRLRVLRIRNSHFCGQRCRDSDSPVRICQSSTHF